LSIDEYDQFFVDAGFRKTGERTRLTEEWVNRDTDTYIMVTRAEELTAGERMAAITRFKRYLGIGYPPGSFGPH
jgi:hypothetical protein